VSTLALLDTGLIRAIDVADGSILWQTHTELGGEAGPAIADGRVYVGLLGFKQKLTPGHKGTMTALNVSTGEILWQTQTHANPSSGSASCVPDTFNNAAVGADGTVYFGWWGGHVYALDGATGSKLSSFATGSGIQGGPAIGDGVVYFQTCDNLYAFRTSS
jgi:outer membrane protein assembly factor BamB